MTSNNDREALEMIVSAAVIVGAEGIDPDERKKVTQEVISAVLAAGFRRAGTCEISCDDDCDATCHAVHVPEWKRRAGTGETTVEWGVFRLDTGAQVGVGTTENYASAHEDLVAWDQDGIPVVLRQRRCGGWQEVPADE